MFLLLLEANVLEFNQYLVTHMSSAFL